MIDLEDILKRRAQAAEDQKVWVEGGWVDPVATVPLELGVVAVVRFARACWEANMRLNQELLELQGRLEERAA